jgi:hypothetical protein
MSVQINMGSGYRASTAYKFIFGMCEKYVP